jgi:tRNA threonylcarbamoyladenosine biosynthesis protein TsaE
MRDRSAGKKGESRILSRSPEETQRAGFKIGRSLRVPGVVLLRGTLGSGKTTLTRGIAEGLGLSDPSLVNSPSFTLINIYHGTCPIYHVDLYRLEGARDLYSIGLDDFLGREGITIIEWSERLPAGFEDAMVIEIEDAGEDRRLLHIVSPKAGKQKRKSLGAGSRSPLPWERNARKSRG